MSAGVAKLVKNFNLILDCPHCGELSNIVKRKEKEEGVTRKSATGKKGVHEGSSVPPIP